MVTTTLSPLNKGCNGLLNNLARPKSPVFTTPSLVSKTIREIELVICERERQKTFHRETYHWQALNLDVAPSLSEDMLRH